MTTTKRDHMAEGKQSISAFITMMEALTELTAGACYAAADKKSADREHIGKEVDAVLHAITAISSVGSMVIAALVSARIQLDRANEQLANLNGLEKIDAAPISDEIKAMVTDVMVDLARKAKE